MSADRDQDIGITVGKSYTPAEMDYRLRAAKMTSKRGVRQELLKRFGFVDGLPSGTQVRFDPEIFEVIVGSNKGGIKTG